MNLCRASPELAGCTVPDSWFSETGIRRRGLSMKNSPAWLPGAKSEIVSLRCNRVVAASFLSMIAVILLGGCGTLPFKSAPKAENEIKRSEVADGENRPITLIPDKPILLLLHGATDDRMEMTALGQDWVRTHNVLLYCYNFHDSLEKIASDFVAEMKQLRAREGIVGTDGSTKNMTVVAYSYGATVFRKAVLLADDDEALFAGAALIQLVPTAGGSFLARKMGTPVLSALAGRVSKSSAAENPYGSIAEELWDDEGTEKFSEVINPARMHTFLVEDDSHSLAQAENEHVRRRYQNGIGTNVVVIPKSTGITHENFPAQPAAIQYLREVLDPFSAEVNRVRENQQSTNAPQAGINDGKR